MASATCPLPVAHTYEDVKAAYKKAQKQYPGLTPAAWRKAAAQDMGLDYATYLKIWKTKGKEALIAESAPATPAAVAPGADMGLTTKKLTPTQDFQLQIKELKQVYIQGDLDESDIIDILNDLHVQYANKVGVSTIKTHTDDLKMYMNANKVASTATDTEALKAAQSVVESAADAIQTAHGPLTHDLAKNVYAKMKKDLPGATPAQLRHAAADYLKVPYDDYLKAWKKPTASGAKVPGVGDLPPASEPPVKPSPAGKYNKQDISVEQLKNELVRLYGQGAQPNFISVIYDDLTGTYRFQMPSSILTPSAKKKVAAELEKLGLNVEKKGDWYHVSTSSAKKTAQKNAVQIKTHGTYTLPDGKIVWDEAKANEWSRAWWRTLNESQRSAVKRYTGSAYREINSALRGSRSAGAVSTNLSSAMRAMDHEFTVFRGTNISMSEFTQGGLWQDKGFMSTAITPGASWSGVKFEIVIPKGVKGAYVDPVSSHQGEKEFIIDKNTKFRVIEVDRAHNRVKMVAIPH